MLELLQAPTEGYGNAIVIPDILAENFELKVGLLTLVTSSQFHGFERDDPHSHIRWFNKITSTLKYKNVPHEAIKLMLFPFSLEGAARIWLEKEPYVVLKASTTASSSTPAYLPEITTLTDAIKDMLLQNKTHSPASIKAIKETYVTCGRLHPYYECLVTNGNTFNASAATGTYNQGGYRYRPQVETNYHASNQMRPPGFPQPNVQNNQNHGYNQNRGNNFNQGNQNYQAPLNQTYVGPSNDFSNYMKTNDANMKAMQNQIRSFPSNTIPNPRGEIKAIITRSGIALDGPLVPPPPPFSSPKEVEHKLEPIMVQPLIPYPSRLNKEKLQDKSDMQAHKFLQIFKKLHFNISLAKYLALMPKLESCMALADLGASINLMPLSVWKKLSLPDLTPTRMTLELATRSIAYLAGIAKDVFVASKHPHKHRNELINMINFIDITCEDRFPEVLKIKKLNHPLSGSTTPLSDSLPSLTPFETSDSLLEEFSNELALLDPFPPGNEDDNFDPGAKIRKIKYLLNQDPSTSLILILLIPFSRGSPTNLLSITHLHREMTMMTMMIFLTLSLIMMNGKSFCMLLISDSTLPGESSEIAFLSSSPFVNKDKVFNPGILILGGAQIFNDEAKDKDLKDKDLILEEHNFLSISSDQELLLHLELPFA
nr:hypothetical protein [Tanacetum cinerariifolium]